MPYQIAASIHARVLQAHFGGVSLVSLHQKLQQEYADIPGFAAFAAAAKDLITHYLPIVVRAASDVGIKVPATGTEHRPMHGDATTSVPLTLTAPASAVQPAGQPTNRIVPVEIPLPDEVEQALRDNVSLREMLQEELKNLQDTVPPVFDSSDAGQRDKRDRSDNREREPSIAALSMGPKDRIAALVALSGAIGVTMDRSIRGAEVRTARTIRLVALGLAENRDEDIDDRLVTPPVYPPQRRPLSPVNPSQPSKAQPPQLAAHKPERVPTFSLMFADGPVEPAKEHVNRVIATATDATAGVEAPVADVEAAEVAAAMTQEAALRVFDETTPPGPPDLPKSTDPSRNIVGKFVKKHL